LRSGDIITTINQQFVSSVNVQTVLAQYIGQPLSLSYVRNNDIKEAIISCPEDNCLLGVAIQADPMPDVVVQFPLPQAMVYAAREVRIQFEMTTSIL
jgi:hypothetical protein